MQTFELLEMVTARLWTNTCPTDPSRSYGGIAIEVSIPRGGRCEYGLLGARLASGEQPDPCRVSAPEHGDRWHGSLVEAIDEVYAGLPAEYTEAVRFAGEAALSDAGSDIRLDYDCACHGRVGSSPRLFGRLAEAVACLHADPAILQDEERLRPVLEELALR